MGYVYEVELNDIVVKLPNISPIEVEKDFSDKGDLFLCALGFEDRCMSIPRTIADKTAYRFREAVYFEYSTNTEDNEINRPDLLESLTKISGLVSPLQCDTEEFAPTLRKMLERYCQNEESPKITFDISVCSSKLLLETMQILLDFDVELRLLYSEANTYHPTRAEIEKAECDKEDRLGLTKGVSMVFPSREHPGYNPETLADAVIAFATFSPERTRAVLAHIDENLLEYPGDRVIWIIGKPHQESDYWRAKYVRKINEIPEGSRTYELSTFDYKETLRTLCKLHEQCSPRYHLDVSPLGSKMQSLGIALFHYIRPDVTVVFAPPVQYDASHYSEGCRDIWKIDFGRMTEIENMLDDVGIVKMKEKLGKENG